MGNFLKMWTFYNFVYDEETKDSHLNGGRLFVEQVEVYSFPIA
jgi:hypothetical protein